MFPPSINNIFFYAIFSAIPALGWLLVCLYLDRQAPEPKKEVWRMFFGGAFIVLPALLICGPLTVWIKNSVWFQGAIAILVISFLVDGLIEETAKYLILRKKIYRRPAFDEPRDGMIYGMIVGIGFAFVENILYATTTSRFVEGISLIFLRAITASFMHILACGIVGYHLAEVKFYQPKNKKFIIFSSLFLAIGFHGLYNTIIRFDSVWNIIPLAVLILSVCVYLLIGLRRFAKFPQPLSQKPLF